MKVCSGCVAPRGVIGGHCACGGRIGLVAAESSWPSLGEMLWAALLAWSLANLAHFIELVLR